jgi:8-oxo-dGTP pyrophosphatase MutT (NUDIX family)
MAWEILKTETVLESPYLTIDKETVRLPNGRLEEFYIQQISHWVAVMALTADGHIVTLEEYRQGSRNTVRNLPAGHIDAGEDMLVAAQRELLEETGYGADSWERVGCYFVNPARTGSTGTLFVARNAALIGAQNLEDVEDIKVVLLTPAELLDRLADSSDANAMPFMSLAYRGLHKLGYIK